MKKKTRRLDQVQFNVSKYAPRAVLTLKRNDRGLGVYWGDDWQSAIPGDLIERCPIILVPNEKGLFKTPLQYFAYSVPGKPKAYAVALGYGSLYNHSNDPNAAYRWQNGAINIVAIEIIKPDEEITIDYGYSP